MHQDPVDQLRRSWEANAAAWNEAVSEGAIPNRTRGTNAAVVEAVVALSPRRVLDLGCGEGWLARELTLAGLEVIGVDASVPLVQHANEKGGGTFHVRSYDEIAADPEEFGQFDVVVANFALLHDDILPLLQALRSTLRPEGALLIQTVHPWIAKGAAPYEDGWRTETFTGLGGAFVEAMPWYFRTLSSWMRVLRESGYGRVELEEPHDEAGEPLSLLIVGHPASQWLAGTRPRA